MRPWISSFVPLLLLTSPAGAADPPPEYKSHVAPLLRKYCTSCHNPGEAKGRLALDSPQGIRKGGKRGAVVAPGKSGQSRLVLVLEGKARPAMPPRNQPGPSAAEIQVLKAWIDAGAETPAGEAEAEAVVVPRIEPTVPPREPIHSLAFDPCGRWIAVARHGAVEVLSAVTGESLRKLAGFPGAVNAVSFSAGGERLLAAGGEAGQFGEARLYSSAEGTLIRSFRCHKDCLYAGLLSPSGSILATGSYDQEIALWEVETGTEVRKLKGHNGAVFDLAFRPDGRILASGSADRTVKLWEVKTGERLDTFSQPLKEIHAVAFSPDGARLAAGGADNRIRIWRVSASGREGSNRLLLSRFAHEGAIQDLAYSRDGALMLSAADDRTLKLWDARSMTERYHQDGQSDWVTALAFAPDGRTFALGRLDGSFEVLGVESGRPVRLARAAGWPRGAGPVLAGLLAAGLLAPEDAAKKPEAKPPEPKKPELDRPEPRGLERGVTARVRLLGKHLAGATEVKSHHAKLRARLLAVESKESEVVLEVEAAPDAPRGACEVSVVTPGGESGRVKLEVDDLRQFPEAEPNDEPAQRTRGKLPASFWGTVARGGEADHFGFEAQSGDTIVLDLHAAALGSKLNAVLAVLDPSGRVLASSNSFDDEADPLIAFTAPRSGEYVARVSDLALGASEAHFYRLSVGSFALAAGVHPLAVPRQRESEVEVFGFNVPPGTRAKVKAGGEGEAEVPLDPGRFRSRRPLKVKVGGADEGIEREPNDRPDQATPIAAPGAACGRIRTESAGAAAAGEDLDLFRFEAREGEAWVIETEAARLGSPIDTRIEVRYLDGRPVERLLLQSVRDSHITFRPIDSNTVDCRVKNWEEMELNEYLYLQGEVTKIFRMPQGPDSGLLFYGAGGKRRLYFDTSATTHALEEPCYIVEPHPPGARLVPTGLPTFTLHYQNDDDGERKLGRDSKLTFTAPASGSYLVRVADARGLGGDRFTYRLQVRRARPDFRVTLHGANPSVNAGSGRGFSVTVERIDGFDGDVGVEIEGLPAGFTATRPLVIQAGHGEARGTIFAAADAVQPSEEALAKVKVTAAAVVEGKQVAREVNGLGKIKLEGKPKLFVRLEPVGPGEAARKGPLELSIAPGTRARALLRVERHGHEDLVTFTVDNLPHGVIVDDIGLNGVLIPKGQNEREIFLNAARWVPETSRPCHAVESQAGGQTSPPVLLHVRKPAP